MLHGTKVYKVLSTIIMLVSYLLNLLKAFAIGFYSPLRCLISKLNELSFIIQRSIFGEGVDLFNT